MQQVPDLPQQVIKFMPLVGNTYGMGFVRPGVNCFVLSPALKQPAYSWIIPFVINHLDLLAIQKRALGEDNAEFATGPNEGAIELAYWQSVMRFEPKPVEQPTPKRKAQRPANLVEFQPGKSTPKAG